MIDEMMNTPYSDRISFLYSIVWSDGMGNDTFSEQRTRMLNVIRATLLEKYPETDYRIRFLDLCLVLDRENRFKTSDKDMLRCLLHSEDEPTNNHDTSLEEIEKRMANGGKPNYNDYGDE